MVMCPTNTVQRAVQMLNKTAKTEKTERVELNRQTRLKGLSGINSSRCKLSFSSCFSVLHPPSTV